MTGIIAGLAMAPITDSGHSDRRAKQPSSCSCSPATGIMGTAQRAMWGEGQLVCPGVSWCLVSVEEADAICGQQNGDVTLPSNRENGYAMTKWWLR